MKLTFYHMNCVFGFVLCTHSCLTKLRQIQINDVEATDFCLTWVQSETLN